MLEVLDIGIDNAIACSIDGKVTKEEMEQLLDLMKVKIKQYGDVVVYEEIKHFAGAELSAIMSEFRYMLEMGMSQIKKVAVITDKKWVSTIANFEDKLFRNMDIECFTFDEKEQAIAFLK